jgi:Pyruvate/2-oxoacid:ferredoxin oxidoreductase delta subunit
LGIVIFLIVFTGALYLFKRRIRYRCHLYYAFFSSHYYHFSFLLIFFRESKYSFIDSNSLREWYGFIGAAFSGVVVGVGFYPYGKSCLVSFCAGRHIGIQQRLLSKFRITTNGGQCISCGNCSTYCEMGIDVRSYAEKENIVRSSCVGCGICAAVLS